MYIVNTLHYACMDGWIDGCKRNKCKKGILTLVTVKQRNVLHSYIYEAVTNPLPKRFSL